MKNFLIFKFSRKSRFKLAVIFTVVNILQVILGILTTGWSIYICLSVSKHLYSEKAEITFVFTVTGMYGTHVIFQYLIGIKICEKCYMRGHKKSTKRHLYFWLATGCNTIINVFVLAAMAAKVSKHIVRSIRHSMEKGMRNYLKEPIWKHTIDRWQFNLQCCGVNDFKDWYEVSWLSKYHIDISSPITQSFLLSKDHLHLPVVPWSCCDYNFPMQCFHDPLQQTEFAHLWKEQPNFLDETISNRGCLEVIRKPIEISLICLIFLAVILIINQVIIIVVSRYLYTSCRNAVVLRNPVGPAPGWLFGRDFLAEVKGRTVSEVMLDLEKEAKPPKEKKSPSGYRGNVPSPPSTARESERNAISSGDEEALLLK